jgi:5-methylcytosine-specific restriction endonuclease McrA
VKRPRWTAAQRVKIFTANYGMCHLCKLPILLGEDWEVEHVKARGLGGSDKIEDMKPAHVDCHKGKTREDRAIMAKADRQAKKHYLPRKASKLKSRGFAKPDRGTKDERLAASYQVFLDRRIAK